MNENVFLVSPVTESYVKNVIEKSEGYIQNYQTDNSVYRTVKVLLSVLKYEYECCCGMTNYDNFICDLLGMMAKHADKEVYTAELDTRNIMAELPHMTVNGIQLVLMQISTNIALYELLHDEYTNFKYQNALAKTGLAFTNDSAKKEEDDEFLLKKIDVE